MLRNIITSVAACAILSTSAIASSSRLPLLTSPLSERAFEQQSAVTAMTRSYLTLKEDLADSLTPDQQRLKASIDAMRALCPEVIEGQSAAHSVMTGSDLDIMVSGELNSYSEILNALLTAEIHNPVSPDLQAGHRNGIHGWMNYPGLSLAETEKVPLVSFLAHKDGFFDIGDENPFFNGKIVFPGNALAMPMDPAPNLEARFRGVSVGEYLKEKVVACFQGFNEGFDRDQLTASLSKQLNLYMQAAPRLHAKIQGELNFHTLSLETLIGKVIMTLPESDNMTEAEKMLAALTSDKIDLAALSLYTQKTKKAREQLDQLSPNP